MKKLAIVVTSVLLLLALVGCGTFSYDIRKYVEILADYATNLVISKTDVDKQVNDSRSNLLESYKGEEEIKSGVVGDGMTTYIYYKGVATLFDGLFSFEMGKDTFTGLDAARTYEYGTVGGAALTVSGVSEITGLEVGDYFIRYAAVGDGAVSAPFDFEIRYQNVAEYKVFVNGVSGSDENDGFTEQTAVKTLTAAYAALDKIMLGAPDGTAANIVITGTVTLTAEFSAPKTGYKVVVSAKDKTDGITSNSSIYFNPI